KLSVPLAVGVHTITVVYSGDGIFAPSTSAPWTQVVQEQIGQIPIVALTATRIGSPLGRKLSFNVQATTNSGGIPTGDVVLLDENQQLGPVMSLSLGSASYLTPLSIGRHSIRGVYVGGTSDSGIALTGGTSTPVIVQSSPRPAPAPKALLNEHIP